MQSIYTSLFALLLIVCSNFSASANFRPPRADFHVSFGVRSNGAEGGSDASFNLKVTSNRRIRATETVIVTYYVAGTANEGIDYDSVQHTVRIPGSWLGKGSVTIPLHIIDDGIHEDTEHVKIGILSAKTRSRYRKVDYDTSQITLAIVDNDPENTAEMRVLVSGSANGAEGGPNGSITFSLSENYVAPEDIVIVYEYPVLGNTAYPGIDFEDGSTGIIYAGQHSTTITVPIYDDNYVEDTESFTIGLSQVYGNQTGQAYLFTYGDGTTVSISDNDGQLRQNSTNGAEGGPDGSFIIGFPPGTSFYEDVVILYNLSGSAGYNDDYQYFGEVRIPAGQSQVVVPLNIVDDQEIESTEDVVMQIYDTYSDVTYTTFSVGVINNRATITDNDSAANGLTVYPNPVVDQVTVTIPASFKKGQVVLMLSDINGKVIKRILAKDNQHTLNLRDVGPGTYFITVTNGVKQLTKKIVK
jgi:hypothetical protein